MRACFSRPASAPAVTSSGEVLPTSCAGFDLREIITLEPERKVTFFQATGPREGAIVNELFEDEAGALQLRFYCYLGLRGKTPNGPEEQAEQTQFDSDEGYRSALLSTLKRTRELLAEGQLTFEHFTNC
jgi:hypothetical protein